MRGAEHERPCNRKQPVRGQSKPLMRHGRPDDEQRHTEHAGQNDSQIAVSAIADQEGNRTQWNDDNEHLRVQVALRELRQERQAGNQERQRQAMHEAKSGQCDRCAVEPVR